MHCYTSITNNYIPKARVLAQSLKRSNPDWHLHVLVAEPLHESVDPDKEPFASIISLEDLNIPNLQHWIFFHRVTEICTAAKGTAAQYLFDTLGCDKLVYFDPDISVFHDLKHLEDLLDEHPLILAPHQCIPEIDPQEIINGEIGSLRWGVFNLGFAAFANRGDGRAFVDWWAARLLEHCYDDIPYGIFTDQRWCDLAPIFFKDLYILRDPGYDVATWNLTRREVTMGEDGGLLVDGVPLRFYHYSSYDSGVGNEAVDRVTRDGRNMPVHDIWEWYSKQLELNGQSELGESPWFYSKFSNGEKITNGMRRLYRDWVDLRNLFPNPFAAHGQSLYTWFCHEKPELLNG